MNGKTTPTQRTPKRGEVWTDEDGYSLTCITAEPVILGYFWRAENGCSFYRFATGLTPPLDCNCGFGGFHDDINPRCDRNRIRTQVAEVFREAERAAVIATLTGDEAADQRKASI